MSGRVGSTPWTFICLLALAGCIEDNEDPVDEPGEDASVEADAELDPDVEASDEGAPEADAGPAPDVEPPVEETCGNEDDLFPNQRPSQAEPIEPGFARDDLYLCPETDDWFALELAAGQGITASVQADPPETDLDVALFDVDGNMLAESAGDGGIESLEFIPETEGTYVLRVTGYRDETAFYALSVTTGCRLDSNCPEGQVCSRFSGQCELHDDADCGEDAYEPNDRDDAPAALDVGPEPIEGSLCGGDRDWFALEAEAGDSFDLLIAFDEGEDVDVVVVEAASGRLVGAAANDARFNPERLNLEHLPAGTYLLGLTLFIPEGERDRSTDYTLEIVGRSGACEIDRDCGNANPICDGGVCRAPEPNAGPGERCVRDEDCGPGSEFCWVGGGGGNDNFCSRRCDGQGQCDALGEGSQCVPVGRGQAICVPPCAADADCSEFRTCVEGTCELRGECRGDGDCDEGERCSVTQFGRFCELRPGPAACGADEGNDPNDAQGEATPLPVGEERAGLMICDPDDDWYVVEVPPESAAWVLSVGVRFRSGVDVDLYLFDELGNPLGESTTPDQTEEFVEVRYVAPGRYFARVDQFASDSLRDTEYAIVAELIDNEDACTVEGNECGGTEPLRARCDEESGACLPIEGNGEIELGDACDSQDDCNDDAEVCWAFEGGEQGFNICTITCRGDGDCAAIEGTVCTGFQRVAVCLPPRE